MRRCAGFALGVLLVCAVSAHAVSSPSSAEGRLPSGAAWKIDMPPEWNGALLVFSHGYGGGPDLPARTATDEPIRIRLLQMGYALAASSFSQTGWSVESGLQDNLALVAEFEKRYRKPARTIAWGASMGGLVTLGLVQSSPDTFSGGLCLCGSVGGVVGMLNLSLDGAFVVRTLLDPASSVPLVRLADENATNQELRARLTEAARTPQGLARIALASAVSQVALWGRNLPEPSAGDHAAEARNQAAAFTMAVLAPRAPLEQRAGGNFSWNTGIDYRKQLEASGRAAAVRALYAAAGLDLERDLEALAKAPRIAADYAAVAYMKRNTVPNGKLQQPVMTMASPGDEMTTWAHESALRQAVRAGGTENLLRQTLVHRGGHCVFSTEELVAAIQTLDQRIQSGAWADTSAPAMNVRAKALGAQNPAFLDAVPPPFPRPCTSASARCEGEVIPFGSALDAPVQIRESQLLARNLAAPGSPQWQAKGDRRRTYKFPGTDTEIPYRLYVPTTWDGKTKLPLVVMLHGGGANESQYLDMNGGQLLKLAEEHGYILVSPLGYSPLGAFGTPLRLPAVFGQPETAAQQRAAVDPEKERALERSEKDVVNVLEMVLNEYPIDRRSVFLTGHSMGSGGTWYLGAKYAEYWAAIAPMSGPFVDEANYPWDRIRQMPVFMTEGTGATPSVAGSHLMRDWMKSHGFQLEYKEVDADHGGMIRLVLPDVFDFFDRHRGK
jgi:poly(3-hydroxybutyrate) depolymerase/alpha-beta hydrolase superfamily lysophospholipase